MTLKKFLYAIFLSLVMLSLSYAETPTEKLNLLLKNLRSMKADFTQTLIDNKGKQIHNAKGTMALQRPGQFRWQTQKPSKQVVIANGNRLWIYDPELEQVIIRGLAKQTGETPALLLSDANPGLETDFHVKIEKKASSNVEWFVLTPKDRGSMFASIRMGFVGQELHEMQLKDHLDHTTIILFTRVQANVTLPSSLFSFKPPKNVDIIDETKQRTL